MITSVLSGHSCPLRFVALAHDSKYVASGSDDGSIIIHSTSSNKVEFRADYVFAQVLGLCYLPNGSLVAMMMVFMWVMA